MVLGAKWAILCMFLRCRMACASGVDSHWLGSVIARSIFLSVVE